MFSGRRQSKPLPNSAGWQSSVSSAEQGQARKTFGMTRERHEIQGEGKAGRKTGRKVRGAARNAIDKAGWPSTCILAVGPERKNTGRRALSTSVPNLAPARVVCRASPGPAFAALLTKRCLDGYSHRHLNSCRHASRVRIFSFSLQSDMQYRPALRGWRRNAHATEVR